MSKPVAEAFVIDLARLNPATAGPIRHCLSSLVKLSMLEQTNKKFLQQDWQQSLLLMAEQRTCLKNIKTNYKITLRKTKLFKETQEKINKLKTSEIPSMQKILNRQY